ncbi:GDP-mannose 4,6-dehydratase [Priestia abyssalis]|uniref:GDP-mannose 4,6-dehydratase n=1 Tax=Priestia abyssalis TaxID=1221450 RepID=UPI000994E29C|nr:GDP-mannose 4,6-dehydratase [Priestia abyssalis]
MRALVTGVTGFVGHYLKEQLIIEGVEVFGTSRKENPCKGTYQLDLLDKDKIINLLKEVNPTHIFHLAGMSNVRDSWSHVSKTIEVNTIGTVNLLEAINKIDNGIRVITIGSSEEYGKVNDITKKISEETFINPTSPYGLSKAAVSMLVKQYHKGYGLDVIHIRPFTHIGPGQKLGFVTSDFAYQIALINKGKTNNHDMKVGNLEAIRDFTDVRDIVKAYSLIALNGKAGEVYNVCSGEGTKIQEILDMLLSFSDKEINIETDPERMRPSEVPYFVGDYSKLEQLTNWKPILSLNQSLEDIYHSWLTTL